MTGFLASLDLKHASKEFELCTKFLPAPAGHRGGGAGRGHHAHTVPQSDTSVIGRQFSSLAKDTAFSSIIYVPAGHHKYLQLIAATKTYPMPQYYPMPHVLE